MEFFKLEYPKWVYAKDKKPQIVQDKTEYDQLTGVWVESPAFVDEIPIVDSVEIAQPSIVDNDEAIV